MDEPNRIGLTAVGMAQLDELLDELNPGDGEDGTRLIKFDLYRLVVALGIKNKITAPILEDKSLNTLRVAELDEERTLYTALDNSDLVPAGTSIYGYIERLAEKGIRDLYQTYQSTGQFPFEEYFMK